LFARKYGLYDAFFGYIQSPFSKRPLKAGRTFLLLNSIVITWSQHGDLPQKSILLCDVYGRFVKNYQPLSES